MILYDSLSTIADNLTEGLHKGKCKGLKSSLECVMAKDSTQTFKYMECDKSYDKKLNKDLIKRFEKTYRLFDGDINEFFYLSL